MLSVFLFVQIFSPSPRVWWGLLRRFQCCLLPQCYCWAGGPWEVSGFHDLDEGKKLVLCGFIMIATCLCVYHLFLVVLLVWAYSYWECTCTCKTKGCICIHCLYATVNTMHLMHNAPKFISVLALGVKYRRSFRSSSRPNICVPLITSVEEHLAMSLIQTSVRDYLTLNLIVLLPM